MATINKSRLPYRYYEFLEEGTSVAHYVNITDDLLTYKMENNRLGCINRDKNAINNMVKIDVDLRFQPTEEEIKKKKIRIRSEGHPARLL